MFSYLVLIAFISQIAAILIGVWRLCLIITIKKNLFHFRATNSSGSRTSRNSHCA